MRECTISKPDCPHYQDSHSCYWCILKYSDDCPKKKEEQADSEQKETIGMKISKDTCDKEFAEKKLELSESKCKPYQCKYQYHCQKLYCELSGFTRNRYDG